MPAVYVATAAFRARLGYPAGCRIRCRPLDLHSLKIDRRAPAPARSRTRWPLRATAAVLLGASIWLFWPAVRDVADRLRLPAVQTFLVTESAPAGAAAIRGTSANGYIVAGRRAALSSDVPGRIVELNVREGAVVRCGDVVARLFADEYRAALHRAEADVGAAAAAISRAQALLAQTIAELAQAEHAATVVAAQGEEATAQLEFAELEVARIAELFSSGIEGQRSLDEARTQRDAAAARQRSTLASLSTSTAAIETARQRCTVAAADVEVGRAQHAAAQAARDLAQATLDKTDVRAPFDGVVVLKDAEVGEVVSPNVQGGSTARGAVVTLVDFDSLEVQANVPETTLPMVRVGAPADVFLDAWPDDRYPGTVDRIWPTADRQKATIEVRIRLDRKDDRLRPEMGVRVVFRAGDAVPPDGALAAARPAIVVPEQALVEIGGRTGAFVIERDTVRFALVTAAERRGGRVAIDAGLRTNQRIVLDPPPSLRDGDRIRLVNP